MCAVFLYRPLMCAVLCTGPWCVLFFVQAPDVCCSLYRPLMGAVLCTSPWCVWWLQQANTPSAWDCYYRPLCFYFLVQVHSCHWRLVCLLKPARPHPTATRLHLPQVGGPILIAVGRETFRMQLCGVHTPTHTHTHTHTHTQRLESTCTHTHTEVCTPAHAGTWTPVHMHTYRGTCVEISLMKWRSLFHIVKQNMHLNRGVTTQLQKINSVFWDTCQLSWLTAVGSSYVSPNLVISIFLK